MTSTDYSDGAGSVTRDAKFGHLINGVVTVVGLAAVEYLGSLDFSTLPAFLATLAPVAAGQLAGWITNYFLPRYANRARPLTR